MGPPLLYIREPLKCVETRKASLVKGRWLGEAETEGFPMIAGVSVDENPPVIVGARPFF